MRLKSIKRSIKQQISPEIFQNTVLKWFDVHGRKTLPWQIDKTPYKVWVSEIMLQQTQVATVIPYFLRFTRRFPDVVALAQASEDEVLHLWTGLGYYSRARNLLKSACIIAENQRFPDNVEELMKLPGIGQSTAGAIVALGFGKKAAILDGNVKRLLARLDGLLEWPGEKPALMHLWALATQYTPSKRIGDYTQAMMDLGATLCIRGTPRCGECPFQKNCRAYALGLTKEIPKKKPANKLPIRKATLLVLLKNERQDVLLEKRPATGIWGGLFSLPEISGAPSEAEILQICQQRYRHPIKHFQFGESFRHTFSHFHLDIVPAFISLSKARGKIMEDEQQIWYNLQRPPNVGLPAPVKNLLMRLTHDSND